MKKNNVLLIIIFSSIFLSCGKKEGNNDATEAAAVKEVTKELLSDCGCNELILTDGYVKVEGEGIDVGYLKGITKEGSKELFTGSCTEKDQNDSIIKKVDVKNGWLIKQVLKKKIGKIYVTTMDLNFENENPSNGWVRYLEEDRSNQNKIYFRKCIEYKNGKIFNEWEVSTGFRDFLQIKVVIKVKDGKEAQLNSDIIQPKCMPDSEFINSWELNDISPERYNEIFNCLKGELPHFNYWKI